MLKHTFRLVKVVECGDLGYTSVVELSTIPEEWIDHPQFGRCRITSCEEVERVQSFKKAGYKLIVWNE